MKIAVNTRLLLKDQMEGIGRFTHELFSRMVRQHPEHEFHFFFDRPYDKEFIYAENVVPHVVYPPVRHPFLAVIWFDYTLKMALKKLNPDVFISPDSQNMLKPVCPMISVIHDINFAKFPELIDPLLRRYYNKRTPIIAQNSVKVITVSEFSKKDIVKEYHIDASKVRVVYNASGEEYAPLENELKEKIRLKYSEGKDYFVFIGGLYRRKNLLRLIEAFEFFKSTSNVETQMVIVGRVVKEADELMARINFSPCKDSIKVLGRLDDMKEVREILGSALALTYVSVIEGFGIPLVEAMKMGVPAIASNISSIPEVLGDAGLYVDPFSPRDIADQMQKISQDEELRQSLIQKGLTQVQKFDWAVSAEKLMKEIEELGTVNN